MCPGHGVYACMAEGEELWAAPRGGEHRRAPYVHDRLGELIEGYILDFEGDDDSVLRLEFQERLRGERRFEDPDALIEQMRRDEAHARDRRRLRPAIQGHDEAGDPGRQRPAIQAPALASVLLRWPRYRAQGAEPAAQPGFGAERTWATPRSRSRC